MGLSAFHSTMIYTYRLVRSLPISTPLRFVITTLELRNIELTTSWWKHHSAAYQSRSEHYVKFDIFLMSYADDPKLGVLLSHISMS